MGEQDGGFWLRFVVIGLSLLGLFIYAKMNLSQIRDLQRRAGQLESEQR